MHLYSPKGTIFGIRLNKRYFEPFVFVLVEAKMVFRKVWFVSSGHWSSSSSAICGLFRPAGRSPRANDYSAQLNLPPCLFSRADKSVGHLAATSAEPMPKLKAGRKWRAGLPESGGVAALWWSDRWVRLLGAQQIAPR